MAEAGAAGVVGAHSTGSCRPKHVVICGGGIMGAALGYYLTRYASTDALKVTVLERAASAGCAASGKAGGFLAKAWCDQTSCQTLARVSFGLHEQLSDDLGGRTDYRRLDGGSTLVTGSPVVAEGAATTPSGAWPDGPGVADCKAREGEVAQVHPLKLTQALVEKAVEAGAVFRPGTIVSGVKFREQQGEGERRGRVLGVAVGGGEVVEADVVIIAMGPWSIRAAEWIGPAFPRIACTKAHSLCIRAATTQGARDDGLDEERAALPAVPPRALFVKWDRPVATGGGAIKEQREEPQDKGGAAKARASDAAPALFERLEPECYPRPDGDVYVCCTHGSAALADDTPLPDDPADVVPSPRVVHVLREVAAQISSHLRGAASRPLLGKKVAHAVVVGEGKDEANSRQTAATTTAAAAAAAAANGPATTASSAATGPGCVDQACYYPQSPDGQPVIGHLGDAAPGVYACCGHGVWGILLAPGSALALACDVLGTLAYSSKDDHRADAGTLADAAAAADGALACALASSSCPSASARAVLEPFDPRRFKSLGSKRPNLAAAIRSFDRAKGLAAQDTRVTTRDGRVFVEAAGKREEGPQLVATGVALEYLSSSSSSS